MLKKLVWFEGVLSGEKICLLCGSSLVSRLVHYFTFDSLQTFCGWPSSPCSLSSPFGKCGKCGKYEGSREGLAWLGFFGLGCFAKMMGKTDAKIHEIFTRRNFSEKVHFPHDFLLILFCGNCIQGLRFFLPAFNSGFKGFRKNLWYFVGDFGIWFKFILRKIFFKNMFKIFNISNDKIYVF